MFENYFEILRLYIITYRTLGLVCKTAKELRDVNEVAKSLKPTLASKQVIINIHLLPLIFLMILEFDYI